MADTPQTITTPSPPGFAARPDLLALVGWTAQKIPPEALARPTLVAFLRGDPVDATSLWNALVDTRWHKLMPAIQKACPQLVPLVDGADLGPASPVRPPPGMRADLCLSSCTGAQLQTVLGQCRDNKLSIRHLFVTVASRDAGDAAMLFAALRSMPPQEDIAISFRSHGIAGNDICRRTCLAVLDGAGGNPQVQSLTLGTSVPALMDGEPARQALRKLLASTSHVDITCDLDDLTKLVDIVGSTPTSCTALSLRAHRVASADHEKRAANWNEGWFVRLQRLLDSAKHADSLCVAVPFDVSAALAFPDALTLLFDQRALTRLRLLPDELSPLSMVHCLITALLERNQHAGDRRLAHASGDAGDTRRGDASKLIAASIAALAGAGAPPARPELRFEPGDNSASRSDDERLAGILVRALQIHLLRDLDHLASASHLGARRDGYWICRDLLKGLVLLKRCFAERLPQTAIAHAQVLEAITAQMALSTCQPALQPPADPSTPDAVRLARAWLGPGLARLSPGVVWQQPPCNSGDELLFGQVHELVRDLLHDVEHHLRRKTPAAGEAALRQQLDAIRAALYRDALRPAVEQLYCRCMGLAWPLAGA